MVDLDGIGCVIAKHLVQALLLVALLVKCTDDAHAHDVLAQHHVHAVGRKQQRIIQVNGIPDAIGLDAVNKERQRIFREKNFLHLFLPGHSNHGQACHERQKQKTFHVRTV